jgi:hypothetical protein
VTSTEIDALEIGVLGIIKIGTILEPQFAWATPFIADFIQRQFNHVRTGLADGTVVPDGAGGLVQNTNSRVMPDGSLRKYDPAIDKPPPRRTHVGL